MLLRGLLVLCVLFVMHCAPKRHAAEDAVPVGSAAECPGSDTVLAPVDGAQSARPRGIGYPGLVDPMPDHVAYLTFDDGPSEWTDDVLDILREEGVFATFFISARQLKGERGLDAHYIDRNGQARVFRDALARAVREGHAIGNHTADHHDLSQLDTPSAACQFDENERLVRSALGAAGIAHGPLTLLRPPFGAPWRGASSSGADASAQQARIGALIAARGLNVLWTIDSSDSREWAQGESFSSDSSRVPAQEPALSYDEKRERILHSVLSDPSVGKGSGVVVLLHDTHNATRDALPAMIAGLRAAGYGFATLEEYAQWRWQRSTSELIPREESGRVGFMR